MKRAGVKNGSGSGAGYSTENEYRRRINLAIEYMQNHLDEPLPLEDIASAAHFSAYHFHRIFRAFTGETAAAYGRRLRLDRAAWHLLHRPELSVTDVGFSAGFSSSSDFARAFRKQFSSSPTDYRKRNGRTGTDRPAEDRYSDRWIRKLEEKVDITTLPDLTLARVLCTGLSHRFRSGKIRDAYARLYGWARSRGVLVEPARPFGIYLDNPEVTPFDRCRYLACLAVAGTAEAEGEVGIMKTKPDQSYATCTFLRNSPFFPRRFFRTSLYLYRRWIPDHGFIPSDAPILEAYRFGGRKIRYLDLLLPVEPFMKSGT